MSGIATKQRRTGNLPAELTRFVGRQRDLGRAHAALRESRLVTLCGAGGVGKTRLAVHLGKELERTFTDGAWLVELSGVSDPAHLAAGVAGALRLPDHASGDPLELLTEQLTDQNLLLILDTCEHLIDQCALLSEVLLRAAPGLRILATSREPLDVPGEHEVHVAPMETPAEEAAAADIAVCESVVLFTERARAVVPGFAPTDTVLIDVARLCRRLDGIPLALELAAVRLRALSIERISDRLDDRFRLLGANRGSIGRHQTLRAAIEWSHDLCTADERRLWARLSVFPGSFDLESAERICGEEGDPAHAVMDSLGRLVEKSIVTFERDGQRYRMLDTLRDFGGERLGDAGDRAEIARRHRDHFLGRAELAAACELSDRSLDRLAGLHADRDSLRASLKFSLATPGEEEAGLRMAVALTLLWVSRGMLGEAQGWLGRALESAPRPGALRCLGLLSAAEFASLLGESEAAAALLEEAREAAEPLSDPMLSARLLASAGMTAFHAGRDDESEGHLREAITEFRRLGFPDALNLTCYAYLATLRSARSDPAAALGLTAEGLAVCDTTGEPWCRAFLLLVRAMARFQTGDRDGAVADVREGLRVKADSDDMLGIAMGLDLFGMCTEDTLTAAEVFPVSERIWRLSRSPMSGPSYLRIRRQAVEQVMEALSPDERTAALRRGTVLTAEAAIALALGAGPGPGTAGVSPLTRRELEIAELVAEGLSNREIAERLVISKRTADSHVEHILAKLGFGSRTQIARWAQSRESP